MPIDVVAGDLPAVAQHPDRGPLRLPGHAEAAPDRAESTTARVIAGTAGVRHAHRHTPLVCGGAADDIVLNDAAGVGDGRNVHVLTEDAFPCILDVVALDERVRAAADLDAVSVRPDAR